MAAAEPIPREVRRSGWHDQKDTSVCYHIHSRWRLRDTTSQPRKAGITRLKQRTPQQISLFSIELACGTFAAMRNFPTLIVLLLLSISVYLAGQEASPATGTISTAAILEKSLIATGGIEAHQRLQSLSARGAVGFENYISSHPLGD